jgi:hypothetical protein
MQGVLLGDGTTLAEGLGDGLGEAEALGVGCVDGVGEGLGGVGLGGHGSRTGLGETTGVGLGSTTAVVVEWVKISAIGTITRPAATAATKVAAPHSSRRNDLFTLRRALLSLRRCSEPPPHHLSCAG